MMNQQQQLLQLSRERMSFDLKVKYDKTPTKLIPTAKLVCEDLEVKVKHVGIIFHTHKKAWLIRQIELDDQMLESTILQETTDGAWVAFEYIHSKELEIKETFQRQRKASKNIKLLTYPLWFIIFVMGVLEGFLIYKSIVKKEPIILTREDWTNISWISVAIILAFILIFVLILRAYYQESYFRLKGLEYVSIETLDFYLETKDRLGRTRSRRFQITCQVYQGFYYHPDKPEKIPFASDREPLSKTKSVKKKLQITKNALVALEMKKFNISEELEELEKEKSELFKQVIEKSLSSFTSKIEQKVKEKLDRKDTEKTSKKTEEKTPEEIAKEREKIRLEATDEVLTSIIEEDPSLKELSAEIKTNTTNLTTIESEIKAKEDDLGKLESTFKTQYTNLLKDTFRLDPKEIQQDELDDFIYGYQKATYYKNQAATNRNIIISLRQNISGLYSVNTQNTENFEERLAITNATRRDEKVNYIFTPGESPGQQPIVQSAGTGVTTSTPKKDFGVSPQLWNFLITLLSVGGVITGLVIAAMKLFDKFSEKPGIAIVILVAIAIVLLAGMKLANMFANYLTHSESLRLK